MTVRTLHHYDRLSSDPRVQKASFIVEHSGTQRSKPATLFAPGELKSFVKAELPLEDADRAHNGSITGHRGKIVIRTQSASQRDAQGTIRIEPVNPATPCTSTRGEIQFL